MPQTIQCPTCAKKFRLPDCPPATFPCTGCQTVMDLSGFRAAVPEVAAAPAPDPTPSSSRATASSAASRTGSRAGSSASRGSRSKGGAGASRSRARGRDAEEGDTDGNGRGGDKPKNSNTLLIASLIALVVLGGLAFLVFRSKPPAAPPVVAGGPGSTPAAAAPTDPAMAQPTPSAGAPSSEPGMEDAKPPETPKFVPATKVNYEPIDHHPDATPEERTKIDELIQKAVFENAGSDSRIAGAELVAMGIKAAPRLINVFSTVKMGEGFEDRLGKIKVAVAEGLLRRIDGYIERSLSPKNTPLKGQSDTKWVERCTRYWIAWWVNGKYKTPQKPWDERIDGNREDAPDGPAKDGGTGMSPDAPGGSSGGK